MLFTQLLLLAWENAAWVLSFLFFISKAASFHFEFNSRGLLLLRTCRCLYFRFWDCGKNDDCVCRGKKSTMLWICFLSSKNAHHFYECHIRNWAGTVQQLWQIKIAAKCRIFHLKNVQKVRTKKAANIALTTKFISTLDINAACRVHLIEYSWVPKSSIGSIKENALKREQRGLINAVDDEWWVKSARCEVRRMNCHAPFLVFTPSSLFVPLSITFRHNAGNGFFALFEKKIATLPKMDAANEKK